MRLVILDSALKGRGGHHYAYDMAVGGEAKRRGLDVVVLSHGSFPADDPAPLEIRPLFSRSCYDKVSHDPITGAHQTFGELNAVFRRELDGLPRDLFGPGDLVWVPTTTENQLRALIDWAKAFPAEVAPRIVITLLMPAGVTEDAPSLQVHEPLRALYYRLMLGKPLPPWVRLTATGRQLARDYSYLAGREIPSHPLLMDDTVPLAPPEDPRCILLYAGESFPEKGVTLLPAMVRRLATLLPDWRLLVHANDSTRWQTVGPIRALEAMRAEVPSLDLRTGFLETEAYNRLLTEAAVVVTPYNQTAYRSQTSGVLWEAVHAGRPVIVPRGTYLEREAKALGASHATIDTADGVSVAEEIAAVITGGALSADMAMAAGRRFRELNGLQAFMDELLSLAPVAGVG